MVYLNNMKTKNQTTVIDYKNQEHIIPIWSLEDFYLDEPDMPIQTSLAYKLNNDLNNGYYIEIGAGHYKKQNNTYYLENKYNWTGISIDIEQPMVDIFNNNRKNKCIQADAITFNWEQYLVENNFPKKIDFLSIDVDFHSHPHANLLALLNLPLTKYQFNIISIEHGSGIFYGDAASSRPQCFTVVEGSAYSSWNLTGTYLDSPATTSSTTYKTQQRAYGSGHQFYTQVSASVNGTSTITLMEIAA